MAQNTSQFLAEKSSSLLALQSRLIFNANFGRPAAAYVDDDEDDDFVDWAQEVSTDEEVEEAAITTTSIRHPQSLLHLKLYGDNVALQKRFEDLAQRTMGKIPGQLDGVAQSLARIHSNLQEALVNIQQASTGTVDLLEAMQDLVETGERCFPRCPAST